MNKRGHVLNGLLLGVGLGYLLEPAGDATTFVTVLAVTPPIVLGALFPDIDTVVGSHRKTLHNLPVLAFFFLYSLQFGNLQLVWLGVLSHYVLDVAGSTRGIALFYPYPTEFGLPTGVATSSKYAQWVTAAVTAAEVWLVAVALQHDLPVATIGDSARFFAVVG